MRKKKEMGTILGTVLVFMMIAVLGCAAVPRVFPLADGPVVTLPDPNLEAAVRERKSIGLKAGVLFEHAFLAEALSSVNRNQDARAVLDVFVDAAVPIERTAPAAADGHAVLVEAKADSELIFVEPLDVLSSQIPWASRVPDTQESKHRCYRTRKPGQPGLTTQ